MKQMNKKPVDYKQDYLNALEKNNDKLDEIALGENIGLNENETKELIDILIKENKIEFKSFGLCSYKKL